MNRIGRRCNRLLQDSSGKGTIRTLFSLLIVGLVAYGGLKFVPVRAAAFQFDDEVREQVVLAGSGRRRVGDAEVRRAILARAENLGLPVDSRAVVIRRSRTELRITVEYTVPVELPGYTYDWHFVSEHAGPIF
jgi:hypothetical protein